jgi:hypothetical protein
MPGASCGLAHHATRVRELRAAVVWVVSFHAYRISFRNLPGKGCVFVIEVPLAEEATPVPQNVG